MSIDFSKISVSIFHIIRLISKKGLNLFRILKIQLHYIVYLSSQSLCVLIRVSRRGCKGERMRFKKVTQITTKAWEVQKVEQQAGDPGRSTAWGQ